MARRREIDEQERASLLVRAGALLGMGALVLFRALPLLLLLGLTGWGARALWREALADPSFQIAGDTLSLSGSERFCPEAIEEVERLARCAEGESLLAPGVLRSLRQEYQASPWVRRVIRLRRVFPNRVMVEFVLRRPALQVRQNGYYWFVDDEGVLLRMAGRRKPLPEIPEAVAIDPNALGKRPTRSGERWSDPAVLDVLALLRGIRQSPVQEQVRVERVRIQGGTFLDRFRQSRRKRSRLEVETQSGQLIRWGTVNRGDLPDELSMDEKLTMLRNLYAREFAHAPGVMLDVRGRVPGFALPR